MTSGIVRFYNFSHCDKPVAVYHSFFVLETGIVAYSEPRNKKTERLSMIAIFMLGCLAGGMGTTIGCLTGWLIFRLKGLLPKKMKMDRNIFYASVYEFSSGLMMAVVTFHLLPEAIDTGGLWNACAGLLFGMFFLHIAGRWLHNKMPENAAGMFLLFGVMLHNIPEGIAIGTSALNHFDLAISLLTVITIHDIPEGISCYLSLQTGNKSLLSILGMVFVCMVPTGVAALFGSVAGESGPVWNAILLGFAAGSMLYILTFELSREAKHLSNRKICEGVYILGLLLGILLK